MDEMSNCACDLQIEAEIAKVLVQAIQLLQIFRSQFEVQNFKVFLNAVAMDTFGNSDSSMFNQETVQNLQRETTLIKCLEIPASRANLRRRLVMALSDLLQLRLLQQDGIFRLDGHTLGRSEWAVCREADVVLLAVVKQRPLLEISMALDLKKTEFPKKFPKKFPKNLEKSFMKFSSLVCYPLASWRA
jgi:hypothetical protein